MLGVLFLLKHGLGVALMPQLALASHWSACFYCGNQERVPLGVGGFLCVNCWRSFEPAIKGILNHPAVRAAMKARGVGTPAGARGL